MLKNKQYSPYLICATTSTCKIKCLMHYDITPSMRKHTACLQIQCRNSVIIIYEPAALQSECLQQCADHYILPTAQSSEPSTPTCLHVPQNYVLDLRSFLLSLAFLTSATEFKWYVTYFQSSNVNNEDLKKTKNALRQLEMFHWRLIAGIHQHNVCCLNNVWNRICSLHTAVSQHNYLLRYCHYHVISNKIQQLCSSNLLMLHSTARKLWAALTPSMPAVPNCCCSKGSTPYWRNQLFLIFDIRALSPECRSTRMSKIKNGG